MSFKVRVTTLLETGAYLFKDEFFVQLLQTLDVIFVSVGDDEVVELANSVAILALDLWDAVLKEPNHVYAVAGMPVDVH